MSPPLWFQNLFAYSVQVALLTASGLLIPRLVRLRAPRVLYAYAQALLAVCLLLPLLQPWHHFQTVPGETAPSRIFFDSGGAAPLATFPIAGLILFVLATGVVGRLAWLALGFAKLARYRQNARRFEPLPPAIRAMEAHLGVTPEFRISEEIECPVTFGLRRPVILLPPRFTEMDADRQQAIAGHEMLHVARRDWAFNLAEEIILAGFWFHPAVWWLVSQIRLGREQVVDRQVVHLIGARKPYLYALVEIAAGDGGSRALLAPTFLSECQLAERIRALVKEDFMSKPRIAVTFAGVVVLTLFAGLASVRAFPLKGGAAAPASPSTEQASPKVFRATDKGVTPPSPIYKPEPGYTKEARAAKLQGSVTLWMVVGVDGAVSDVKVTQGLGMGLAESAVETVKTWKFKPAIKAGKPVPCKVMVEVAFKLY